MFSFDFKRSSRKCAITEKTFSPGEEYVSALIEEEGQLVRKDFTQSQWKGPDESCVGWWTSVVPLLDSDRVYWAPTAVLLSFFESLLELPGCEPTAYVTALLLVQKKILYIVDSEDIDVLHLLHKKSKSEFVVSVVQLSTEQKQQIQAELSEQLFTDQAPDAEELSQ